MSNQQGLEGKNVGHTLLMPPLHISGPVRVGSVNGYLVTPHPHVDMGGV
jgi:hypothetical protein